MAKISLSPVNNFLEINSDQFNQLIASSNIQDSTATQEYLVLALNKDATCRIHPGFSFEILDYDRSTSMPGYIKPLGQGKCDIHTESGLTHIKISRHQEANSSYGVCQGSTQLAHYGPFERDNDCSASQTIICYFTQNANVKDVEGDPLSSSKHTHRTHSLMILFDQHTICIHDNEKNACAKLQDVKHWGDAYSDKFILDDGTFKFNPTYINHSEDIHIADFISANDKINKVICRTKLNGFKEGMKLQLSNGNTLTFAMNVDQDAMFYSLPWASFLFLPPSPNGNLVQVHTPIESLSMDNLTLIGVEKTHYLSPMSFHRAKKKENDLTTQPTVKFRPI